MNNENDLGEELLKQNGMESGRLSDEDRQKLNRRIALEKKRFRRMVWFTVVSWALVPINFLVAFLLVSPNGRVREYDFVLVHSALMVFAVICTISMGIRYFRVKSANMEQIQTTLADIADQLKRLSDKEGR